MKSQEQMLNELLDSGTHLITMHERKQLEIWDLRDRPLEKHDLRELIELYDRVYSYGIE